MVQRTLNVAIVDEIDSCFIHESSTPLVISGAADDKTNQYLAVDKLIKNLSKSDFALDEKDKNIYLTNDGISNVEKIFSRAGVLKNNNYFASDGKRPRDESLNLLKSIYADNSEEELMDIMNLIKTRKHEEMMAG